MIYGIGTDLCDLRRIQATLERRGERFAERVLGPAELQVFHARSARTRRRAVCVFWPRAFSKEAFSKAIGTGIRSPMTWRGCQMLNEPSGKPVIRLSGELADWFAARHLVAHVTVTDETDYVAAFVVVETQSPTA